jgi:hypothetical protein
VRRRWIALTALFLIVGALGAWVYLNPPRSDSTLEHALASGAPALARTMSYAPRTEEAITLQRTSAGWYITAPFKARADGFQVERLLSLLEARASARYPSLDLERYGLDRPVAHLTIDGQEFAFGAVNAMTREQYVLTRDGVHAVPLVFTRLPQSTDQLIARELFAPGEVPVRFELPDYSLEFVDGRWRLTPGEAGADERNAWVDRWRHAAASLAARHAGGEPAATITVELKEGGRIVFGILELEPEVVLARSDTGIRYHFSTEAGRRLLDRPGGRERSTRGAR